MKKYITLFAYILLTGMILFSCEKVNINDDLQLIEAIESASNKSSVQLADLPASAKAVLNEDYSESATEEIFLAENLGYQVELMRNHGTRIGERIRVIFTLRGRELRRNGDRTTDRQTDDGRDLRECFRLVYPVTMILPDRTTITRNNEEEMIRAIRRWYAANSGTDHRPQLQYPVTVEFAANDRNTSNMVVINSEEQMDRVRNSCD
ncbi:MAG: hypothetical protein KDE26_07635 [Bacteroidetes bacterium]|nr:hypothetical protein [Bacteroidota bacterium]